MCIRASAQWCKVDPAVDLVVRVGEVGSAADSDRFAENQKG